MLFPASHCPGEDIRLFGFEVGAGDAPVTRGQGVKKGPGSLMMCSDQTAHPGSPDPDV